MALVKIDQSTLLESSQQETFLTADVASGSSTITVSNISGFAVNQILIINPFSEKSEIILTHASTSPSGSTITLKAATTTANTHYTGERVVLISYDQVEISNATTLAGSKSVLTTSNLQPDQQTFVYNDTAGSTGYYFARFKNSITSAFSSYTDGLPVTGWVSNTVGYMINQALKRINKNLGELLTKEFFYNEINECLRKIKGKQLRWPEHAEEDYIAGQAIRGINTITLPSDIYDNNTNKSITGVRIGTDSNLTYLDPTAFESQKVGVAQTQVRTQASATDTSLAVDNSYDFDDSGALSIYVSGTKYSPTYTGVTRDDLSGATGAFTGVPSSGDGSITVTIPVDTNVWQGETEGTPQFFTVRDGELEFWPLVDSSNDDTNIYLDYDKVATEVNSDGDEIDLQRYGVVLDYITWKAEATAKNDGKLDMNSGWYLSYKESLNDAIRTSVSGKKFRWKPNINRMARGNTKDFISNNDRRGNN